MPSLMHKPRGLVVPAVRASAVGCLVLTGIACSNPTHPDRVAAGTWGGLHVVLEVSAEGGRVEYDCAHGALNEPLMLDESGRFDVTGTHTAERGGPVREDDKLESRPARYAGRVDGRRMTLTVTLTDSGEVLDTFTLMQGAAGRLLKCL